MTEPRVRGVNHIGLAPKDPVKAAWFLREALGLKSLGEELVAEQKTLTIMFATKPESSLNQEGERLEILVPEPSGSGPIAHFLEKKGSGIHHLALTVDSIEPMLSRLKNLGIRLIDEYPRSGAHRTRIAFVHPESTGGLLVELVEQPSDKI